MTYNEGKEFFVVDALPFERNFKQVIRPMHKYMIAQCDDPRDWLEGKVLDRLRLVAL